MANFSQPRISGKVVDKKGKPIAVANVFVEGSSDGATTNETGGFSFKTDAKGIRL